MHKKCFEKLGVSILCTFSTSRLFGENRKFFPLGKREKRTPPGLGNEPSLFSLRIGFEFERRSFAADVDERFCRSADKAPATLPCGKIAEIPAQTSTVSIDFFFCDACFFSLNFLCRFKCGIVKVVRMLYKKRFTI